MAQLLEHKHLIVQATVKNPPKDPAYIEQWTKELVEAIGMKIAKGPIAFYSTMEGNVGLTCMTIIETSHIALHVFEDANPCLLEFDLYTCSTLDVQQVLKFLDEFQPLEVYYMFLDREFDLTVTETGRRVRGAK